MKKFLQLALASMLGLALVACSGGGVGETASSTATDSVQAQEDTALADDAIKIDEIDYEVKDGIESGNRRVLFSYTNNSPYTIVDVCLEMAPSEDVADEELESAFADRMDGSSLTADDLRDVRLNCESSFAVEPGQTSEGQPATYGIFYVTSMQQYEIMQPDMMAIRFLHEGKMYEEYYDYRTGSYTLSSDTIDPNQWGQGELGAAVPRPEGALVESIDEDEDSFWFDVICMTREDFDAYVEACRDAGYTVDVSQTDTSYRADNEDGTYRLDLTLLDELGRLNGHLDLIEPEEE